MEVVQLINSTERRGGECFAIDLADELASAGCDVEIIALSDGCSSKAVSSRYVPIYVLPRVTSRIRRLIQGAFAIFRRAKRSRGTFLVQANIGDTLYAAVVAKLISSLARQKLIVVYRHASVTSYWLGGRRFSRAILGVVLRSCDAIATISPRTELDLLTLYPVLERRTRVIPNGVDPKPFREQRRLPAAEPPVLLHVGAFTAEKNQIALIDVLAEIHRQGIPARLLLVGDGPLLAEVKLAFGRARLEDFVDFIGASSRIPYYMANAHLLILPSLVEGVPGVLVEVMFSGLPAVAYNVGSVGDMLADGRGVAVRPGDSRTLAVASIRLLKDDAERARISKLALAYALRHYDIVRVANDFHALYRSVME